MPAFLPELRPKVMKLRVRLLREVSLVDAGANQHASVLIHKRQVDDGRTVEPLPTQEGLMAETQLEKALADLRAAEDKATALSAKVVALEKSIVDKDADLRARDRDLADANLKLEREVAKHADPEEELLKGMSEPGRRAFLAQKAETEKLRKRLEADDEARATAEIAKGIATDMPHLPVKPDEFAPILKKAKLALDDDGNAELTRILKGASEAHRLMTELTKRAGHGSVTKTSTEATVEKLARERSVTKAVTYEAAYTEIMRENPAFYSAIMAEQTVGGAN